MRLALLLVVGLLMTTVRAEGADDASRLVLHVQNAGDVPLQTHAKWSSPTSSTTYETGLVIPPYGSVDVSFRAPPGRWNLEYTYAYDALGQFHWIMGLSFDSTGCEGDYRAALVQVERAASADPFHSGCLAPTTRMTSLIQEARQATGRDAARPAAPRAGDAGRFLETTSMLAPDWSGATNLSFKWNGEAEFSNAFGQPTRGVELAWARHVPIEAAYAFAGNVAGNPLEIQSDSAVISNQTEVIQFEQGDAKPLAYSQQFASASSSGVAGSQAAIGRTMKYSEPPRGLACLFREPLCDAWSHGAPWRAGSAFDYEGIGVVPQNEAETTRPSGRVGIRVVPYYAVQDEGGLFVARVLLADGVAYPVEAETYALPEGGTLEHSAWKLVGLETGGELLPLGEAPPTPSAPLAANDPLRGPALASRARFAFPLDEASDAARMNPTLTKLQGLIQRGDAALVGARYGTSSFTSSWTMAFSSRDASVVFVTCERAASVPVPRCSEDDLPDWSLFPTPRLGRGDVPIVTASWDDALAQWPESGPVGRATYRVWDDVLRIGAGASSPIAGQQTSRISATTIHLQTGAIAAQSVGIARATGLLPGPEGFDRSPFAGDGANFGVAWSNATSIAVAAGVIGIAALLVVGWLLFTRLQRREVLDSQTRQEILDLVRDEPGIHASAILERVGKAHGVGDYHLGVLVREGFLSVIESPGFKRYFVSGRFSFTEMRALAALKDGQSEKLFRIIQANPGIHLSELADRAGISLPYASRAIKRLHEAGLVDRLQVGRNVSLHAIEK